MTKKYTNQKIPKNLLISNLGRNEKKPQDNPGPGFYNPKKEFVLYRPMTAKI